MSEQIVPYNKDSIPDLSERIKSIQAKIQKRQFPLTSSMLVGGQTKYISAKVPKEIGRIELLHLTDVQWSNQQCNVAKLTEYRDWVLATEDRYVLFGGDMCDLNTMLSVGKGAMEQREQPDEQIYSFAEFIAPIAHRVLGYVGGNHEQRGQKIGHDFGAALAAILGIPYSAGVQHIDLYFGKWQPFKIYLWHGRGAARTTGAKAQMMVSVVMNDRANLYLSGHIHSSLVIPGIHIERDHKEKQVRFEKYYCVSSTSFLNYYGSYAEATYYPVSYLLMGCAFIDADRTFRISI